MKIATLFVGLCLVAFATNSHAQATRPQSEADYYELKTLSIPENVKLEVGGLTVLPDGRIAVSTRRGEIWMIENPYGVEPRYSRFASGMHETLGLNYRNGSFYCTQRGELTKITDTDNDGRADLYQTIYKFDLSGNYHEYAYGPVFDKAGDMYVSLNVAWIGYGEGLGKWHGWLLKIKEDGTMEPIATGLRSPAGIALNTVGDVFYAENQGDWVGSGRVTHLEKGDFAGNAGGLRWTKEPESPLKLTRADLAKVDNGQPMFEAAKVIKELKLPAVWFPHTLMGISTADILEDTTNGAFGPFAGQYFVSDQGHSKIMRMTLEKVNGKYQGACYPFREGFASGLIRLRFGLDGSMFGGMTSRGWSSTGPELYALQRLVWTGKVPFEIKNVKARPDGFELEFTLPVNKTLAQNASHYEVNGFTYHYHHQYGSEIINNENCALKGIIVSDDGKKVRLVVDNLREGYINEVKLTDFTSDNGTALLHNTAYYTLNAIPQGEKVTLTEAQKVHAHHAMAMPEKTTAATTATTTKTPAPAKAAAKRQLKMPADWKQPDQVISLGTKPGLKFDVTELQVKAGSKIKVVFNNNDDMTHNFVVVEPGAAKEVGDQAFNLGLKGSQMNYIPNSAKVLFHTNLIQPGTAETIYFTAPTKPGTYTYLCTYPGHAMIMQGTLKVTK
ncbi:plastocyanin/azurin family copper-binding protein [Chryseolinea lacunae]|uniref:Auracyanin family protein n=1 Tax=Chryseolinea lacunae TaxID=2801331 RepID=A0ABS1KVU1_9BACT|nr:plastocyanin/azurin family copper-binding protein [Chryseolinea lacunae]MBL0743598.1 auracyanin family protein [Chryseolinea lacunae]